MMTMRVTVMILLAATLALLQSNTFPAPSPAFAADTVQFPSAADDHASLTGALTRPSGAGPFPAVVLLPGCDGALSGISEHYLGYFQQQGYVVLALDENGSRHVGNVCSNAETALPILEIAKDAVGAHAYLRSLNYVDANRIAVIGWSWGGSGALVASFKGLTSDDAFRAAVAFYPQCAYLAKYATSARIPVLILIGGSDDWALPTECAQAVQASVQNGQPVTMQTFPGAVHAFDTVDKASIYLGHHIAPDPSAAAAARTVMQSFLSDNMK